MAVIYAPYFNAEQMSLGTITLARAGGYSDAVVNMSTGVAGTDYDSATSRIFSHLGGGIAGQDPDTTERFRNFSRNSYASALETSINVAAGIASWPGSFTVAAPGSSGGYAIAYSGGANFSITWSATAGRNLLGFTGNQSGAQSYTGSATPTYMVISTLDYPSNDTTNYEPEAIGNHSISDNGSGYGISRTTSPLYRDFSQEYETKAKTLRLSASSSHPWTFQHLFEHCRGVWPFVLYIVDQRQEVFSFRTEGIPFHPERATPGNDAQFHIPFRCIAEGTIT